MDTSTTTLSLACPAAARASLDGKATRRSARGRKLMLAAAVTALSGLGAGFGWQWWRASQLIESTNDAYVRSDISVVSPKVEGYVRRVWAAENQPVHAGDTLVTIDDRDFAVKVAEGKAKVQAQQAALRSLQGEVAHQRAMVEQATAALEGAEAERRRAQQDLRRYQSLARADVISGQRLETATADMQKAEAAVQKARAAQQAEMSESAIFEGRYAQAEAMLRGAEAALKAAELDLDGTVIRAPVDGVVGNRGVQVGQLVKPGTQLLSIVPLPNVYVVANFKETQVSRMHAGQKVDIEIDAFPGAKLEGHVASFSPATGALFSLLPPENATGNFTKITQRLPVRIDVPKESPLIGLLRPGLSVTASVDVRETADGRAPTAALTKAEPVAVKASAPPMKPVASHAPAAAAANVARADTPQGITRSDQPPGNGTPVRASALALSTSRGSHPSYHVGETLDLRAAPRRDGYLYCYYQDAGGTVARVFPNRFQADAFVHAGTPVQIPAGPNPAFRVRFDRGHSQEQVACIVSDVEIGSKLPEALAAKDLSPLPIGSLGEMVRRVRQVTGLQSGDAWLSIAVQ